MQNEKVERERETKKNRRKSSKRIQKRKGKTHRAYDKNFTAQVVPGVSVCISGLFMVYIYDIARIQFIKMRSLHKILCIVCI